MSPIEVPAKIQLVEKRETRTSRGMLSKGWYHVDDQLVMVKGNSITEAGTAGYEPYSEVMASLIAQVLNLPHVEYTLMPAKLFPDIQTYSCDVVSVCPKFITDDEQLYHFADLADAHFLASGRAVSPEALFQYAIELYGKKWLYQMLEVTKSSVQITTYASYQGMVERIIAPYFRKRGIKLVDLKATDLQDFYTKQLERVKANSVIHYHANIHKALKYAVKIDLIPTNPADKVERPKKNAFKGSYYSAEEIHALTEVAEGTKLEIPVLLASFYGLRRSEVLGLKWDAIDFEENTLEIKHIVTQASIDGKKVLVQADRAKTKSSLRTLPLVPPIRDRLLMLKGQQETYRRLCGKSYNRDYLGYLCVDEIGNIIRPNYVSEQFPKLLEKNGLRPIRFHDLRHSCASLLLANGVPMKQIQEWLGHSDFSTTANIYAHLDYASKLSSAQAMLEGLGYGNASA